MERGARQFRLAPHFLVRTGEGYNASEAEPPVGCAGDRRRH